MMFFQKIIQFVWYLLNSLITDKYIKQRIIFEIVNLHQRDNHPILSLYISGTIKILI